MMRCRLYLLPVVLLLGLAACAGPSRLDDADAGRTVTYQPGLPNFDLEAVATLRDGQTGVDLYLGIPRGALVFVQMGDDYVAHYEQVVRLLDRRSGELVREVSRQDTVRAGDYEATQSYRPLIRQERLDVAPGMYIVEVTVQDRESEARAVRRQAVEVRARGEAPSLSRLRLEARQAGRYVPVVSLHMPARYDSLRAVVELYNLGAGEQVEVLLRLMRFESDTSIATPPYWLVPSRGSLTYRGIHYDRVDTLQVTRRALRNVEQEAVVEVALPELQPGIYRVEIAAQVPGTGGRDSTLLVQQRELSVKQEHFPQVTLLDELVEALAYLAFENEIAHIQAAEGPQEARRRFDAFWGSLVPNRQVAANLIKLYYSRVEEANLFFTSFKEGWKTDRGMIYIILGAPIYVEDRIDGEIWHYSYNDEDPVNTFVFERVRNLEGDGPFEQYILQRRPYYQQVWSHAVDRWREGVVL